MATEPVLLPSLLVLHFRLNEHPMNALFLVQPSCGSLVDRIVGTCDKSPAAWEATVLLSLPASTRRVPQTSITGGGANPTPTLSLILTLLEFRVYSSLYIPTANTLTLTLTLPGCVFRHPLC